MSANSLSSLEIDAIGEILNISLGASATAVSTMLDARVDITTPVVQVKTRKEFEFSNLEPAVGVEITYIDGLTGSNIMLLKRGDVKVIVEMLMGMEIDDEDFELNEMNISAICEVMNQMMGASSTALSELLGKSVNISTPVSFEVEDEGQFKEKYFEQEETMVVIGFTLKIAEKLESEFMNLMPLDLARELVAGFFPDGLPGAQPEQKTAAEELQDTEEEKPELKEEAADPAEKIPVREETAAAVEAAQPMTEMASPEPAMNMYRPPEPQSVTAADPQLMQQMTQMIDLMRQQMEMQQDQMQKMQTAEPKKIHVNSPPRPNLSEEGAEGFQGDTNMELIMGVPLEISVEIGRTKKLVRDILELNKGSLVVLDKLAGDQVDLFVNGQCIAKGDVVVVDDNFGIRITEILQDDVMQTE